MKKRETRKEGKGNRKRMIAPAVVGNTSHQGLLPHRVLRESFFDQEKKGHQVREKGLNGPSGLKKTIPRKRHAKSSRGRWEKKKDVGGGNGMWLPAMGDKGGK